MADRQMDAAVDRDGLPGSLQERLDAFIEREIEIGSFPGAVYAVGSSAGLLLQRAHGYSVVAPAKIAASVDTIYDVASLTKPLVTSTLALIAANRGIIDLDDPVSKFIPELGDDKRALTFVDLLTHRAGFQAWYPMYAQGAGEQSYLQSLVSRPLRYRPGTREIYSCLGYLLLYLALQRAFARPLAMVAEEMLFAPLELRQSMFNPQPEMKYAIAATDWGNSNERLMVAERKLTFNAFRNYMIWGEVNDGNAFYIGGFGGNAGLFASASDVFRITRLYLRGGEALVDPQLISRSLRNYTLGMDENRALGWQLQMSRSTHPSSVLSENAFGHTGFTGTSVWADPARDLVIVILTNRIHPSVKPVNMQILRRRFHEIVVEEWDRQ